MSQIATFFVPLSGGAAEQEEMNAFLRGHRVLQVEKAFAGNGWAFCVEWLEGGTAQAGSKPRKTDYREKLEPEVFARFVRLRERRRMIALEDGVPPYMVMTDAQMAEAAKAETLTVAVLKGIDGFGDARVERYGIRLTAEDVPAGAVEEVDGGTNA